MAVQKANPQKTSAPTKIQSVEVVARIRAHAAVAAIHGLGMLRRLTHRAAGIPTNALRLNPTAIWVEESPGASMPRTTAYWNTDAPPSVNKPRQINRIRAAGTARLRACRGGRVRSSAPWPNAIGTSDAPANRRKANSAPPWLITVDITGAATTPTRGPATATSAHAAVVAEGLHPAEPGHQPDGETADEPQRHQQGEDREGGRREVGDRGDDEPAHEDARSGLEPATGSPGAQHEPPELEHADHRGRTETDVVVLRYLGQQERGGGEDHRAEPHREQHPH